MLGGWNRIRMNQRIFELAMISVALLFTVFFVVVVVPALLQDGDIVGAFAAGFVNPYSSGYSFDVIVCWFALAIWVFYERSNYSVKHGWFCLLLGVVPGVAVGLSLYIVLRARQLRESKV